MIPVVELDGEAIFYGKVSPPAPPDSHGQTSGRSSTYTQVQSVLEPLAAT